MRDWEKEFSEEEEEQQRRGLFERVMNLMGFVPQDAEEEEEERAVRPVAATEEPVVEKSRKRRPHVVSLPGGQRQLRVVVFEPRDFEEVQGVVDQLKNTRPVIVNLDECDKAVARRVVDFVSGAVYALGGGMQKINLSIFLFTPPNVEIAIGPRGELRDRSFFNLHS